MSPNRSEFPLTRFLGMLMTYTDQQLLAACAKTAAARYSIPIETAAAYIEQQRSLRGMR